MLQPKRRAPKPLCCTKGPEHLTPGLGNCIRAMHEMEVAAFYLLIVERGDKSIHTTSLPKGI